MKRDHERRRSALNRIRSGFVQRLACGDVRGDLLRSEKAKDDLAPHHALDERGAARIEQHERSRHLVSAVGQPSEHGDGIGAVPRLAERLAVDDYDRVGAEHPASGAAGSDLTRLLTRDARGEMQRAFPAAARFVGVARLGFEPLPCGA